MLVKEAEIYLPCYNIHIQLLDGVNYGEKGGFIWGGGNISSTLHEEDDTSSPDEALKVDLFNAGIDALESIILAHAMAGVDVESLAYIQGIETAAQSLGNEHS